MCECLEPCVAALSEAFCAGAGALYSKKNDDYGRRRAAARTLIATVLPYQLEPHQLGPTALSGLNYRRHYLHGLPHTKQYHVHGQYSQHRLGLDGKQLATAALLDTSATQGPAPVATGNTFSTVTIASSSNNDIEAQHHQSYSITSTQSLGLAAITVPPWDDAHVMSPALEQDQLGDKPSSPNRTTVQTGQLSARRQESQVSEDLNEDKQQVNVWGQPLVVARPLQQAAIVKPSLPRQASKTPQTPCPKHVEAAFGELMFGQIIGEGGFGKVYYGSWRGQTCAIKLMNYDAGMRSNVVEEFRREVTTMSSLTPHENILRLLGACTKPPTLALVTEYCSRGSLYAMLHSPAVYLSWSQIVHMCLGAARGMAHLHANRILHRDLKSGNLLVDGHFNVKVADFGLSKLYVDMQTMTGGLGTYQWMAPEVLANQRYSEKADVYSFGIVLWECSARQVPYAGMNGLQAALAVMNKGHRPEIPRHTPRDLADLISMCWAPIPEQRPSFVEITSRLEAFAEKLRQMPQDCEAFEGS